MSFDGDLYPEAGASKVITSKGDLVRGDASGNRERYGIGSTGQVLTVASGTVAWATAGGGATAETVNASLSADFSTTSNSATVLTGITFSLPTITDGKCFIGFSCSCYRSTAGGIQGYIATDTTGSDVAIAGTGRGAEVPSATYASEPKWNFASQAIHDADGSDITYYCWTGGGTLYFKGATDGEYGTSMSAIGVG